VEDAIPAFEAAPTSEVEAEADENGWDPEPYDAPTPLRPNFTFSTVRSEPAQAETIDEFSFSFEPESANEERFEAPPAWMAPVALVAREPRDEERPWWETDEDEDQPQAMGVSAESPSARSTDLPESSEPSLATIPFTPTLTPTVDEDPWDEVIGVDFAVPETNSRDSSLFPAETGDETSGEFAPAPAASTPVTAVASVVEERTFAFDAATSDEAAAPENAWGNSLYDVRAVADTMPLETVPSESDADHLAASLESQMAVAEDESAIEFAAPANAPMAEPGAQYEDDDDVVLRAFNAHAATPDVEPAPIDRNLQRAEDLAFGELLGAGAADIVADAADEEEPARSFLNPTPWIALRRDRPENPFDAPWEEDEGEPLSFRSPATDLRPATGAGSGSDLPWGGEFSFDEDGSGQSTASHARHDRTKTVVREVVETVMLALLVFLCVRASFQNFKVDGSSMYPTLENGQFLIVNKLVYSEVDMEKLSNFIPLISASSGEKRNVFHGPERGDIVVLQDPRKPEQDLIKRVIGLPGETLEIVDGKLYINDFRLEEPYIKTVWHDNKPKILVPPGQYFVMGDNRDNSLDSRSQQVGFVPKDLIIGKSMVSYWPKSKFGLAPNEAGNISTKDGVPRLTTQTVGEARLGR